MFLDFTEIDQGWAPAIINNNLEVAIFMKQHIKLSNSMNNGIGGATTGMGTIQLSEYMQHHACEG